MPYQPTTNFKDSNNVDLGKKLVTKDYLLSVYGSILDSVPNTGLTVTPALWGWGQNTDGQLGINNRIDRSTPVTTFAGGNNWKSVSCGNFHTAAIKTDGTLWLWGNGGYGPLGNNNGSNFIITPITTFAGGNNWKSVSCGFSFTTAIKTDGSLWVWGRNDLLQLGTNNQSQKITPVTTFAGGNDWKSISCGFYHTAAIKTDGSLWVWGRNYYGQLGINSTITRSTPVTTIVGGNNWKSVSCGESHIASIKTDGTLWIWGRNLEGEIGNNSNFNRSTPVTTFAGGNNWKSVSCGAIATLAIKTDGSLWTWGYGGYGLLGDNNSITNRSTPVTTFVGGFNWKFVSSGLYHSAAIKTDGSIWTWGLNSSGQLGINSINNRSFPVTTFAGGTNWKSVSCGLERHTVAIKSLSDI